MPDRPGRFLNQRGAALVLVVWGVGVLAFTAAQLAVSSRLIYSSVHLDRDELIAETMLDGAVRKAVSDWDAGAASRVGDLASCFIDTGWLSYRTVPANARISLNASSEDMLAQLAEGLGAESGDARAYAAAIADYRDADSAPRLYGAERLEYRALGLSFEPRNAPMMSNLELHYVPGLDYTIIEKLRDHTSAQNHNPSINHRYASDLVKSVVNVRTAGTKSGSSARRSNRSVASRRANASLGSGPVIVTATVSVGSMKRTVEVSMSAQSTATQRRIVVQYRPIYHYHLAPDTGALIEPCFQSDDQR